MTFGLLERLRVTQRAMHGVSLLKRTRNTKIRYNGIYIYIICCLLIRNLVVNARPVNEKNFNAINGYCLYRNIISISTSVELIEIKQNERDDTSLPLETTVNLLCLYIYY